MLYKPENTAPLAFNLQKFIFCNNLNRNLSNSISVFYILLTFTPLNIFNYLSKLACMKQTPSIHLKPGLYSYLLCNVNNLEC